MERINRIVHRYRTGYATVIEHNNKTGKCTENHYLFIDFEPLSRRREKTAFFFGTAEECVRYAKAFGQCTTFDTKLQYHTHDEAN